MNTNQEIENQKQYMEKVKNIIKDKKLKYTILTMGCQLNENDSEKICGMLEQMGYTKTEDMKEANIAGCMMFCSLTDSADVWADKISSITQYDRISFMQKILDKGYDISHIASKLQESYLSYVLNLK